MIIDGHHCRFDGASHLYTIDDEEVISVTQALVETGCVNTKWFTEWARHRGSRVHKALEFMIEGTLDLNSIDPRIQGYLDAYVRYVEDTGFLCSEVERRVWSLPLRCGGTLDQLGDLRGKTVILDTKTGVVGPATGLQLTGYADLYRQETGIMVDTLIGLQLKPDGTYRARPFKPNFKTWRSVIDVAWWIRQQ